MNGLTVAVITTRNEAQSIAALVDELKNMDGIGCVVVVDDQSSDGTPDLAAVAGAHVIRTEQRMGIGPALMMGWAAALRMGGQQVVQMDAGGSHSTRDVRRLLGDTDRFDIVIGSRFLPGSLYRGRPMRRWMSRGMALACNARTGVSLTDWTSGFRAFRADALRLLLVQTYQSRMHGWQIEVVGKALHLDLAVGEAPITYTAGRSAFNGSIAKEAVNAWRRL